MLLKGGKAALKRSVRKAVMTISRMNVPVECLTINEVFPLAKSKVVMSSSMEGRDAEEGCRGEQDRAEHASCDVPGVGCEPRTEVHRPREHLTESDEGRRGEQEQRQRGPD